MTQGIHVIPDMIKDDEENPYYFGIESIHGSYCAGYRLTAHGKRYWLITPNDLPTMESALIDLVDQFESIKKSLHDDDGCTFWIWDSVEGTYKETK
jgi:hypothetical protein